MRILHFFDREVVDHDIRGGGFSLFEDELFVEHLLLFVVEALLDLLADFAQEYQPVLESYETQQTEY